jgi:hypothetical protein
MCLIQLLLLGILWLWFGTKEEWKNKQKDIIQWSKFEGFGGD